MKKCILLFAFLLIIFIFAGGSVFALGQPTGTGANTHGKTTACQAKVASIKTRMTQLTTLATNMESNFDSIATRVEHYYMNIVVPSGKTVPNYSALITAISTQKTAAIKALSKTQADANAFNCTSASPKTQAAQFRVEMQAVKEALKEYRTSIKNLIVAVHSITGEENKTTPTP